MNSESGKVQIGVLGAGGRMRGTVAGLLASDPDHRITVRSIFDPARESVASAREEFGHDFTAAATEDEVVSDPGIDWVFIGSWNADHARQAIKALNAGKNVFCEKPLATNPGDCLKIREAVQASGRIFSFGLVLRYSPHYRKIHEIIASGVLGNLVSLEFNETLSFNHGGYIFGNWRRLRENAGTHMLEKCCHDLDLANWLVDSVPVRVASFGGRNIFDSKNSHLPGVMGPGPQGETPYHTIPDPFHVDPFTSGADILDNQVAILEYANGVRATFHTNCHAAIEERRFYMCGTRGALRADLCSAVIEYKQVGWDTEWVKLDSRQGGIAGHGGGDAIMEENLRDVLLGRAAPLATVDDGLRSAIVAFGIDDAADRGCVIDLRDRWQQAGVAVSLR